VADVDAATRYRQHNGGTGPRDVCVRNIAQTFPPTSSPNA